MTIEKKKHFIVVQRMTRFGKGFLVYFNSKSNNDNISNNWFSFDVLLDVLCTCAYWIGWVAWVIYIYKCVYVYLQDI